MVKFTLKCGGFFLDIYLNQDMVFNQDIFVNLTKQVNSNKTKIHLLNVK